jgi:hypothetical protein
VPTRSVGPGLDTNFVTHQLLWNVLDAQRANAMLSGPDLRAAADDLGRCKPAGRTLLMAFGAVGERIIGAAIALSDDTLELFDYTSPFPAKATCLLVGGVLAGPAAAADAAAAVVAAGAQRVELAVIGGWPDPIEGVSRIRHLGGTRARVA